MGKGEGGQDQPGDKRKNGEPADKDFCLKSRQLQGRIAGLTTLSNKRIQEVCKEDLKLPSKNQKGTNPLLTQRMVDQRLAFAMEYRHYLVLMCVILVNICYNCITK